MFSNRISILVSRWSALLFSLRTNHKSKANPNLTRLLARLVSVPSHQTRSVSSNCPWRVAPFVLHTRNTLRCLLTHTHEHPRTIPVQSGGLTHLLDCESVFRFPAALLCLSTGLRRSSLRLRYGLGAVAQTHIRAASSSIVPRRRSLYTKQRFTSGGALEILTSQQQRFHKTCWSIWGDTWGELVPPIYTHTHTDTMHAYISAYSHTHAILERHCIHMHAHTYT